MIVENTPDYQQKLFQAKPSPQTVASEGSLKAYIGEEVCMILLCDDYKFKKILLYLSKLI